MSDKEIYELEIARNAEGSKLAYMALKDGETGYRIAGPKAWGGSKELASIEIRQDDLVEFVISYAPQALAEILRRTQPPEAVADKVAADKADAERYRYAMNWDNDDFAVCYRDSGAWWPCKTNGPIDKAIHDSNEAARQSIQKDGGGE